MKELFTCNFIDVVVETKYRAYQQERLPYVEQQAIGHILYGEYLITDHYHACDNQNHGTKVLYFLVCRHSPITLWLRLHLTMRLPQL